jgi:hypothetical protein
VPARKPSWAIPRALKSWSSVGSTLVAAFALGGGALIAAHHPLDAGVALAGFAAWVACAWRWPHAWLFVVPALLPAASLAPWTGWQMVDEFDLLLLGALAAGHARLAWAGTGRWSGGALALLAVAATGLLRGWLDAGGGALDWFHSYPEAGNSLRVARSLVYAALCAPLLPAAWGDGAGAARLRGGMLAGLALVAAVCLWERWAYPGLLDFAQIYRTTALFWEMHVGGAAIDAYLAFAIPFLAWALHEAKSRTAWLGWALFALAVAYAALTTFSRGLYAAALLGLLALAAQLWRREVLHWIARLLAAVVGALLYGLLLAAVHERWGAAGVALALALSVAVGVALRRPGWGWRRYAALALAAGLLTEAVAVLGPGSFMRERWRYSDPDLTSRWDHWAQGLKAIDGPVDALLGIGLGRLPTHLAASGPAHEWSGTARWVAGEPAHLHLGGPTTRRQRGGGFALTQRVALPPGGPWRVAVTARAKTPVELHVELCERHLLYDGRCQAARLNWTQRTAGWQSATVALDGSVFHHGAPWRGGVFTLSVVNAGGALELARVQLLAPDGRAVLRNARFERGLAHWVPSAQEYFLPWHVDNLYLEWLVETGLFGLAVFLGLCVQAARNLARAGPATVAVPYLAASLIAVLLVGSVSSIIDAPRVAFLLLLTLLLAARVGRPQTD